MPDPGRNAGWLPQLPDICRQGQLNPIIMKTLARLRPFIYMRNRYPDELKFKNDPDEEQEEEKMEEERQVTIDALNQGKNPYFATKCNYIFYFKL